MRSPRLNKLTLAKSFRLSGNRVVAGDLLGDVVIPQAWLPGETLFSLCARHHRLSGNLRASSTCLQLFGHPSQGSAHDFPSRIDHFVSMTRGQLGSVESIIRGHTVLPLYLPFTTAIAESRLIDSMAGMSIGSLKYQLGLLTSRFRANHPLKACMSCVSADRVHWGVSYWHVHHQIPGVWVCPIHGELLVQSSLKATGVRRFQWCLPELSHMTPPVECADGLATLKSLAHLAIALWSLPAGTHVDLTGIADTYRLTLRDKGLVRGDGRGRLNHKEVGVFYASFLNPLRQIAELCALPQTSDAAAREVARLASAPRSGQHPIRHISMMAWLGGEMSAFIESMSRRRNIEEAIEETKSSSSLRADERNLMLKDELSQLVAAGRSVSSVSRALGVDPHTGMAWLTAVGVATKKRPSLLKGDIRVRMISALKRGASKSDVASAASVSIGSVTRLLRTEVGLRDAWMSARYSKRHKYARDTWEEITMANPKSGVKAVRMLRPDIYAWLYRNDREWLMTQSQKLPEQPKHGGVRVDWDARDKYLASQVADVSLKLAKETPNRRVKLWQIYQRLPELKAKLGHLDRLPLTQAAIKFALSALPNAGHLLD